MRHDATGGLNYSFDQENRITGAPGYTYTYDADGNRVEKSNGATGTIYWYMSPGIVAESDFSGALKSEYVFFDGERMARKDFPSNSVFYYFSDHLKTASVITDSAGNIKEDEDYYPWGGELQFVNNDSNHYKFTGKERDTETGLDYFGARYYSNWLGRWTSPDWASRPEEVPYSDLHDPQSLNLDSYVRNIPTTNTDKDGHECNSDVNGNMHCIVRQSTGDDCNLTCQALFHSPDAQKIWSNAAGFGDAISVPLLTFVQTVATAGLSEVFIPAPLLGTLGEVEPVAPSPSRLPQDTNVNPTPPPANNGNEQWVQVPLGMPRHKRMPQLQERQVTLTFE